MSDKAFDIELNELELKYRADDISLTDFISLMESMSPERKLEVSSWDIYYAGNKYGLPFDFIRHRKGDVPELTIKIRNSEKNNQDRFELDLKIHPSMSSRIVAKFANIIGFEENFRIYKDCTIYWLPKVDLVYYIVYDKNKKEKARFIEIEARKDVLFDSPEEAWNLLKETEAKLAQFGITPQSRMKKSLWDMFKKDTQK